MDSQGFDPPAFSAGSLEGQNAWVVAGGGGTTATVQSDVTLNGAQAVRVDRAAQSDRFWAQPIGSEPTGRFVTIDWDMLVEATAASSGFGPFFGVNVFEEVGGTIGVVSGFGVDATTGDVLFQAGGSGVLAETGVIANFGEWLHYQIEIDFATDTYNAFVEGVEVVTAEPFVDGFLGIDGLSDADIVAFAGGGDAASQALEGVAFFDNFLVRDGVTGDYNGDGLVDAADYTTWRDQLGQTGLGLAADGNANGEIEVDDFRVWQQSFGRSNVIPTAAAAVPEPGAALLLLFPTAIGRARRR